jgi:hypothetical protein
MDFMIVATAPRPSNPLRVLAHAHYRHRPRVCSFAEWIAVAPAPVELELRKTVFGGSPCRMVANNTLNVSRATLGANPLRVLASAHEPDANGVCAQTPFAH